MKDIYRNFKKYIIGVYVEDGSIRIVKLKFKDKYYIEIICDIYTYKFDIYIKYFEKKWEFIQIDKRILLKILFDIKKECENYKEVNMNKEFKKKKLNNGCIIQTRDGDKYILLKNASNGSNLKEDLLIDIENGMHLLLDNYDDDLRDKDYNTGLDIIKICDMAYVGDNIKKHLIDNTEYWTAEREENKEDNLHKIIKAIEIKTEELNVLFRKYNEIKNN